MSERQKLGDTFYIGRLGVSKNYFFHTDHYGQYSDRTVHVFYFIWDWTGPWLRFGRSSHAKLSARARKNRAKKGQAA